MMAQACTVPRGSLLQAYVGQGGTYTDCFEVMSPHAVTLPEFIEAFYTTWLFRLERWVLTLTLRRWITDDQVRGLAEGADRFAAWTVEGRADTQILLCDLSGHTRSFLAVAPNESGATQLLFGSAVVGRPDGTPPGVLFRLLLPVHRFYARALIRLAERRLRFT